MVHSDTKRSGCLHFVAAANRTALDDCLRFLGSEDVVVFVDAGVLHLLAAERAASFGPPAAVHWSETDLQVHGLAGLADRNAVNRIDDAGICDLLAACQHCLTWT